MTWMADDGPMWSSSAACVSTAGSGRIRPKVRHFKLLSSPQLHVGNGRPGGGED
jgi:hypothetical protein